MGEGERERDCLGLGEKERGRRVFHWDEKKEREFESLREQIRVNKHILQISANIKSKKDIEECMANDMGVGYKSARKKHFAKMAKNQESSKEHDSATRYFVKEVITGFDETDLHRSSGPAQATRSPQERNSGLENMCWRIWNLARQRKQLEIESAQRIAECRFERERGRSEATADISEDLSEGEKGDLVSDISAQGDSTKARLPRINSVDAMEIWINQQRGKRLYFVLISLHGIIRAENMELGRDSDTVGQVEYVVKLARALGSMPGVYRVDLLTRQASSPEVDWSYDEPTEMLTLRSSKGFLSEIGESGVAYIVRIPFDPKDKYVAKELLWPHIPEFVDGALSHIIRMSKVLGEQIGGGEPVWPVAIHGHYADAGDSAALLSGALNVPMLFTGHSLGRGKLEQLLKRGRQSRDEINTTYKIMHRIEAEELTVDASEIIITSTRQEIEEQWRMYDGFDPKLERKLLARIKRNVTSHGRYMPRMVLSLLSGTNSGLWALNSLELLALQLGGVTGEIITAPEPTRAVLR